MKYFILFFTAFFFAGLSPAFAENPDSLGLPGDNLDLTGVLELFKKAKSPEDFEKLLNSKDSKVNNLDLNGDGKVDYIRVVDNATGNSHVIILQDPIGEKDAQDVAVIEIEKKGNETAQLQIIGDQELYGDKYIVQPKQKSDSTFSNEGKFRESFQQIVFVNVWYWPCVQYVWYPTYVVWVSPWYWMYWPGWWMPWQPYPYSVYYGWVYVYHYDYYYCDEYYMHEAHDYYGPRRTTSQVVERRYATAHESYAKRKDAIPPKDRNVARPVPAKNNDRATPPKPTPAPSQGKTNPPVTQPQPMPTPQPAPRQNPPPSSRPPVNVNPTPAPRPAPAPTPVPPKKPREKSSRSHKSHKKSQ